MRIFVTVPYQSDDNNEMFAYGWFDFDCRPVVGDMIEVEGGIKTKVSSVGYFESENKQGDPTFDLTVRTEPVVGQYPAKVFEGKTEPKHWDIDSVRREADCRDC